ncbi:hypothetical protein DFJ58DRAFT_230969 [Suillus subalutaceus]|uniref:uncharacterized protein n=1 Tax=Suillus subalutaceus TaxID=48586 RepID=UPI001B881C05|nr:uncharacterized protein DFJ58DRAFT_230969 [Suillus subalutaceus]KAG1862497.1 hypothetical protein DFJ58DRAFT_230969 [Suillus subalutaceus]
MLCSDSSFRLLRHAVLLRIHAPSPVCSSEFAQHHDDLCFISRRGLQNGSSLASIRLMKRISGAMTDLLCCCVLSLSDSSFRLLRHAVLLHVQTFMFSILRFFAQYHGNAPFHGVIGPQTSTTQLTSSSHQFLKTLKAVLIVHSFPFSTSILMDFQR